MVVYFKKYPDLVSFLTRLQETTVIRWHSGKRPLNEDIEKYFNDYIQECGYNDIFAVRFKKMEEGRCLQYASKHYYENHKELKTISYQEYMKNFNVISRF